MGELCFIYVLIQQNNCKETNCSLSRYFQSKKFTQWQAVAYLSTFKAHLFSRGPAFFSESFFDVKSMFVLLTIYIVQKEKVMKAQLLDKAKKIFNNRRIILTTIFQKNYTEPVTALLIYNLGTSSTFHIIAKKFSPQCTIKYYQWERYIP